MGDWGMLIPHDLSLKGVCVGMLNKTRNALVLVILGAGLVLASLLLPAVV